VSEEEFPDGVEVITVGPPGGGLYNLIFPGAFERGELLLPLLGVTRYADVGRFRDIWLEEDGTGRIWLHLYTRNGGGNRADYAEAIAFLRGHVAYERDEDDSYDSTYASFWFRIPDKYVELLRPHAVPAFDTGERWRAVAERLGNRGT